MNARNGFSFVFTAVLAASILAGGCSKSPPATTAVVNVPDIEVSQHVKTALQQNDALRGFDITVVTLKGDVRLIGVLDSQSQIDEAVKIARASDGAHTLHNELTIKK
jgi:osmotically-inducible protein OsmY